MTRPVLIDWFCCAGGASVGYARAGFEVIGVDKEPRPNYPFKFVQADALQLFANPPGWVRAADVNAGSPPCQFHTALTKGNKARAEVVGGEHLDLIPDTRAHFQAMGKPYIIENVQGSTVRRDLTLCGEMFDLAVIRHRYFEVGNWRLRERLPHKPHRGRVAGMRHGEWFQGPYFAVYGEGGGKGTVAQWQQAMGIDWTDVRVELAEAIPPAYTEFIGRQLIGAL